ncbi:MAG: peptidoglycan-binding protein, partial [bacterium]|nr:peptidoglycan-binding protein [bacterium]
IASARTQLAGAEENLADLLAGSSKERLDTAEAALATARENLSDLLAGPSQADIDAAEAAVLAATETLHNLQNPTDAAIADARGRLAVVEQDLADLLAGAAPSEVQAAEAAVLAAGEALGDLIAPLTPDELTALEQAVTSTQAALDSARRDVADLADGYRSLVVMYGSVPAFRTMSPGDAGPDVRQLEENLAALGFGGADGFSVDGAFDEATENAVRAWQGSLGSHVDGEVGTADVLFVPGPVQVGSWQPGIEVGQDIAAGVPLAALTAIEAPIDGVMATTQHVIAQLPLAERDLLSEGDSVNVELPDNRDVAGTVALINPAPLADAQGEAFVEVTITLVEAAPVVWIGASVDVEITETLARDALVVPATALLALVEGGYALEVQQPDGSTVLIGVETGLFADGDVEVRATGLQEGMPVVVPR